MDIRRGELVEVFTEKLVRKGYTLVGWKDIMTGEVYKAGGIKRVEDLIRLEAIWESKTE